MKTWKIIVSIFLLCCSTSCKQLQLDSSVVGDVTRESSRLGAPSNNLSEVTVPQTISKLKKTLEQYSPFVEIVSPRMGETLERANVEIELRVTDLPLFRDDRLKLGNHLALEIDNEKLIPVYDLEKPIVIENLSPGTHTLRAFAVMPWGESFKTAGAYAQTTFNVLTETNSNYPDFNLPLLTYNSPIGTYGAEPILLDFYLDLPNLDAEINKSSLNNPSVKATINGTSFTIEKWQPYYLTGFSPGENWIQLELIDEYGNSIENVFNNTVRVFNYDPQQQDTLSELVTNTISFAKAKSIVEQNYYIQPVETAETNKQINDAESEIKIDNLDSQTTAKQLPVETPPIVENNNTSELKTIKEETAATAILSTTELEKDTSPTLSATAEQKADPAAPELETDNLQTIKESPALKSAAQKDLLTSSAENPAVIDKVKIEIVPQEIIITDIESSEQPLLAIDVPQADSLQISQADTLEANTQLESRSTPAESAIPSEVKSPSVTIGEDAIAISQPQPQTNLPAPEIDNKFLWWKRLLVSIRQQIESLAKKLPSEV